MYPSNDGRRCSFTRGGRGQCVPGEVSSSSAGRESRRCVVVVAFLVGRPHRRCDGGVGSSQLSTQQSSPWPTRTFPIPAWGRWESWTSGPCSGTRCRGGRGPPSRIVHGPDALELSRGCHSCHRPRRWSRRSGRNRGSRPPRILGLVPLRQGHRLVALQEEELFAPRPGILHGHGGGMMPQGGGGLFRVRAPARRSLEITAGIRGVENVRRCHQGRRWLGRHRF